MNSINLITSPDEFSKLCKHLLAAEFSDFQTIDDSGGDGGNDGYSESEKILFQLYCPKKPNKVNDSAYKDKIKKDLDKAKKLVDSGKYIIEKWIFVTPEELREDVQTYIRVEAKTRGFNGVAWASPKLTVLFTKHGHLRSQFPNLILSDIEKQIDASTLEITGRLDTIAEIKKEYKTKIEQKYQKRIDEAKEKLDKNKNESAKKDYEVILADLNSETEEIDPHIHFRVYNNLGVCEHNLDNHTKAAEFFEKAYDAEPELPMAISKLALSKTLKNVPAEGLPIIDKLLEEYPNDEHFISVKANILYSLEKYSDLVLFLRSKDKVVLTHWYEGFQKMSNKDYTGATDSFEVVVHLEPENNRALQLVAQNIIVGMKSIVKDNPFPPDKVPPEIKEKFLRAIECLKKAIRLLKDLEHKKDLEMAYANLSGCYVAIGLYEESIKAANEATSIDQKSTVPFLNKGIAQLKLGNYKEAIKSFKTFKDLDGK